MPEIFRSTNEEAGVRRRARLATTALATLPFSLPFALPFLAGPARAQGLADTAQAYLDAFTGMQQHEVAALGLTLGVLLFGVVTAVMLVRTRRQAAETESATRDEILGLKAELDRTHALLLSEPQILVAWSAAEDEPQIIGDTGLVGAATAPHRVLAFGTWLDAERASAIEHAVEALRLTGEPFSLSLTTSDGVAVEAEGRAVGGCAILRLREVGGVKREFAELATLHQKVREDMDSLHSLADALPAPVWTRDEVGRLTFVNAAYAHAVEARNAREAVERGLELLDRAGREEVAAARAAGHAYSGRLPAVVAGSRRSFDVLEVPTARGGAGIGIDATEAETMRAELKRMLDAHRRTLDELATAVAIFGADQKLTFYNAAYRSLWDLDGAFLEQSPTDTHLLDRLRASRKLPEEQNFRLWKGELHEAYRALESKEHVWHLPDGRTLRVVTTPNPQGGVTYLFDDVTERLDLERRYDALIRVQGETLDNLAEGVVVFGSDGKARLHNPAFARMWRLSPEQLATRPHIETVIGWCRPQHDDEGTWQALRGAVTAIEGRTPMSAGFERRDGSVIHCATMPLPDGGTLVTFQDVTDTVNVERALRDRTEALEAADQLKIDFVHHVSYELRSPLTTIIGFAHFLGDASTGDLNDKQKEYLGYITVSTNALLAIINNILDLATIDAGAMTLTLGPVDIARTMRGAAEGVQDRLVKDGIALTIDAPGDIGSFVADERRVLQVLYNLLANAVSFSPKGETVTLSAERRPDAVVFRVTDSGPGIPAEVQDKVFDWFETHSLGSPHRGTGLGLSLVRSFVELHGGTVALDSAIGKGTTVTCTFPLERVAQRDAAE